ncbi:MAG: alpha/beta fold hydrolase [Candidatus Hodarchaeota archaeon]
MLKDKDRKIKKDKNVETGFFEGGLPFARIGDNQKVVVNIQALSFKHEPPSGFELKEFIKSARPFIEKYTFYLIGRKQNLPKNYLFDRMAEDYAKMIRREFKGPVDVMGVSTGGQLALYLAADYPDTVRKLIIISAAYRLSEKGVEIERKSAEYFRQGKYGKAFAAILDLIWKKRILRAIAKFFTRLVGKRILGEIKYPNDFLNEIQADREMNFKERLKEIKANTLVMCGESDIAYTAEDVRVTAEGIPNSKLILYNGYGHNLIMRNRKQVYKDIFQFLEK